MLRHALGIRRRNWVLRQSSCFPDAALGFFYSDLRFSGVPFRLVAPVWHLDMGWLLHYSFRMSAVVQYLTDERGERTAVVLPISDYEKLLEDLEDMAVVAERKDEPTIPHKEFVTELKRDGIL